MTQTQRNSSKADCESTVETLKLLSIPGFYESIKEADKQIAQGETYSLDEVFDQIPTTRASKNKL
ncbi:MAG: hypothetical protein HF973_02620 [Chloroflexi bacterium]|nr:hypothetical protein [Chloroflexota bacterium]